MMRLPTPLDGETEAQVEAIIGCAIQVHRELGPGFLEAISRNALSVELHCNHIPFESEKSVLVRYRDIPVAMQRIDLVVCERVIVELKSVTALEPIHEAQLLSYLRATGLRVGLLMHFGASTLRAGLRRIVL